MANPLRLEEAPATDARSRELIALLDAEVAERYGAPDTFGIDIEGFAAAGGYFVLALAPEGQAVGCGALRPFPPGEADGTLEVKRMFVRREWRRRGVARALLRHLADTARARGATALVLETGSLQPEAVALYQSEGYFRIPRYLEFTTSSDSLCFAKDLR